jgi:valyl-tRNA synthetase
MPFVTEELWGKFKVRAPGKAITVAPYPKADPKLNDAEADRIVGRVIALVDAVRSKRGENNLPPSTEIVVTVHCDAFVAKELQPFSELIKNLIKAKTITFSSSVAETKGNVLIPLPEVTLSIPRGDLIDTATEIEKVKKSCSK